MISFKELPFRSRVLVYGYHGQSNFGDELFVDVMKAHAPRITGNEHPDFFRSDEPKSSTWAKRWQSLTARELKVVAPLRALDFLVRALRCRNIAFCGGSLFSNFSGSHAITYLLFKAGLCDVSAYGVSVGPDKSRGWKRHVINTLAVSCDPLVIRDAESIARVRALSPQKTPILGGDLVALSERIARDGRSPLTPGDRYAVYIPCRTTDRDPADIERFGESLPPGLEVRVVSVNSHTDIGDDDLAKFLADKLVNQGVSATATSYSENGIDGVIALISHAEFVVSERLHGALVAYLTSVPFALSSYHDKCDDFAETIGLSQDRYFSSAVAAQSWEHCIKSLTVNSGLSAKITPGDYIRNAKEVYFSLPAERDETRRDA